MDEHTAVDVGLVARWAELFNTDVERMITELYAPDCSFSGVQLGHEKLRKFELRVLAAAPRRTIRVEQTHLGRRRRHRRGRAARPRPRRRVATAVLRRAHLA